MKDIKRQWFLGHWAVLDQQRVTCNLLSELLEFVYGDPAYNHNLFNAFEVVMQTQMVKK